MRGAAARVMDERIAESRLAAEFEGIARIEADPVEILVPLQDERGGGVGEQRPGAPQGVREGVLAVLTAVGGDDPVVVDADRAGRVVGDDEGPLGVRPGQVRGHPRQAAAAGAELERGHAVGDAEASQQVEGVLVEHDLVRRAGRDEDGVDVVGLGVGGAQRLLGHGDDGVERPEPLPVPALGDDPEYPLDVFAPELLAEAAAVRDVGEPGPVVHGDDLADLGSDSGNPVRKVVRVGRRGSHVSPVRRFRWGRIQGTPGRGPEEGNA
ncbi:hypothetical protein OG625_20035 [Streptomyces sp. NBC_01351]|uniref:hypothetical protein n=1 Tax=Streptomyces sp. NBC_01351 TaxID=2903833 RepID=UPI002E37AED8|nr:hypothetical protein [Streptomyces sp. NBC_01351]